MRATTIRFSERMYELLDDVAGAHGTSRAVYIREATVARVWADMVRMGHPAAERFDEILGALREVREAGDDLTELLENLRDYEGRPR